MSHLLGLNYDSDDMMVDSDTNLSKHEQDIDADGESVTDDNLSPIVDHPVAGPSNLADSVRDFFVPRCCRY